MVQVKSKISQDSFGHEVNDVQRGSTTAESNLQEVSDLRNDSLPRRFTDDDLSHAKELMESPGGMLLYYHTKAMVNLCEYKAYITGPPETRPTDHEGIEEEMARNISFLIQPWCEELNKFEDHDSCSDSVYELMTRTRCILEKGMETTSFPPPPMFAFAIEMADITREDCLADLEMELEDEAFLPHCPGEWGADVIEDEENLSLAQLSSESQAAVSATQEVWRASGHIEHLAHRLHKENVQTSVMGFVKSTWQSTCANFGCDASSYEDITDALYGQTANLLELKAPGAHIYHHIRAIGRARRAYMKIMNKMPIQEAVHAQTTESLNHSLSDAIGFLHFAAAPSRQKTGTHRYERMFSQSTRVLSAIETMIEVSHDLGVPLFEGGQMAAAVGTESEAHDSDIKQKENSSSDSESEWWWSRRRRRRRRRVSYRRRRRWGWFGSVVKTVAAAVPAVVSKVGQVLKDTFACASLSTGQTIGYERDINNFVSVGLYLTEEIAYAFKDWFEGKPFSLCRAFKIHATASIAGPVPKNKFASCNAGIAFNIECFFDTCGAFELGISVAFSAGCSVMSRECPWIPIMQGIADCKRSYFVGLTVVCAKFNLVTGEYTGSKPWR